VEIINSAIKYVQDFAATSETTYHINPWLFCFLFFGSALPLYYGYYWIGRSKLKFENKKLRFKKLNNHQLKVGVIISSVAWWIPYIYVIFFGKLPVVMWVAFAIFVLVMGIFFLKTLRNKISNAKKETNANKEINE